jgi:hypothetical protein
MSTEKRKIWLNNARSFFAAKEFDERFFKAQTPAERSSDLQFLQ